MDLSVYFNDYDVDDLNVFLKIYIYKYLDLNIRYIYEFLLSIIFKLNK